MATFPSRELIQEAADRLRRGELVAFPTETVYGLGANALDAEAVKRIFEAKRRPRTSPLIVHVSGVESARELVTEWPVSAGLLASKFWPGPLTIVLPKRSIVPDIVTAGFPTVALRVPRHAVALALLREAGVPVAAPSANLFTRLSPTERQHVAFPDVLVLEGGASEVGIESTVVSLAGTPRLLRPGAVSHADLESVIGPVSEGDVRLGESPGLHLQHYRPRTRLVWAEAKFPEGQGAYLYRLELRNAAKVVRMPQDARQYAAYLYKTLHALDAGGFEWIAIEPIPASAEWAAVQDRLKRAVG